jgi:hypothetical protein
VSSKTLSAGLHRTAALRSRAYANDVKKLLVCAAVAPLLLALLIP